MMLELKATAAVGTGVGVMAVRALVIDPDFVLTRLFRRYVAYLDTKLRFLAKEPKGKLIAFGQIAAFAGIIALALFDWIQYSWAFLAGAAFLPAVYLHNQKSKRIEALELQVDSFLLAYANALKAIPNPAAALLTVVTVIKDPMRFEIDRVLKEMKVGASLEQALNGMSLRLKNRTLDSALSAILIGMQVGGDLPGVLATTAAALREMQRLDGVVKTKTAEGKAQLWVLAAFPFALIYLFNAVEPGYFEPLQQSFIGYVISSFAVAFWLAALGTARKILQVDI